jgi:hypothetical protein
MKKIPFIIPVALIALAVICGCNRKVDSLDPVRSLPDPLAAPINVTALIGDRAVTLTWEMPIATGVSYYRIYLADSANGDFQLRDTSNALTRMVSGLLYNQEYSFAVAAVRSGGDEGKRSSVINVRIPALSIVIESNAEFTAERGVSIAMNAGLGASEFQLSEDSTFAAAPIQNFSTQAQFELSPGDAKKRVYARFYYTDGARTNAVVYDEITLDTRASISSFQYSPSQASFQTGETIYFILVAGEIKGRATASFIGAPTINLYDDGIFPDVTANDGTYTGRFLISTSVSASGVEVTGEFADAAGNDALRAIAPNLLTIYSVPQPVSIVSTIAISTYEISLNWTQSTSPNFQAYRLYRANNGNVNTTSTLVSTIGNKASSGYTDTALNANTQYYYRIYVVDSFGFTAASNVDSARTQVNTAPVAVVLAGSLSTDSSTFQLSWTKSDETDFESYRLYRRNSPGVTTADQLVKIINNQGTDNTDNFVPGPVTVYYKIFVFDRHGLSTGSNEIQLTK